MRPVFVVGGLYSLSNGVAWIMRDLAAAIGRAGSPVTVCGAECYGRGAKSIGHVFEPPSRWVARKGLWLGGLSWSPVLKRQMNSVIASADIVHNHSLWMLPNSYGSRLGARYGKPVVITTHGALEPWALKNSRGKKRLVESLFQRNDLLNADCIHVNSHAEARGVRGYGVTSPIAVIPNGVNSEDFNNVPERRYLDKRYPHLQGKRVALFLARLHEKKGLGHLIPAWAQAVSANPDWHLLIAGPDSGYEAEVRRLIETYKLSGSVTLVGSVQGVDRLVLLGGVELFVQPSFSEGFSMSILEAMACSLPILLTPGCNFDEVAARQAGVCVDPDVEAVKEGLSELMSMSKQKLSGMGDEARKIICEGYTWEHVAKKTLLLYEWLTDGGKRPSFVSDN